VSAAEEVSMARLRSVLLSLAPIVAAALSLIAARRWD
jgi:hypothetical protein